MDIKRKLLIVLFVLFSCSINAIERQYATKTYYGKYGIQFHDNAQDYKNYSGKHFVYIPDSTSDVRLRLFPYGSVHDHYVIRRISAGKNHLKVSYSPDGNNQVMDIIKVGYDDDSKLPLKSLPIAFGDLIQKEVKEAVGKRFTHPMARNTFIVVDAKFEPFDNKSTHNSIVYYVKDELTGVTHRISDMDNDSDGLPQRLFHSVNLASLMSVEKPADSAQRYGKTSKFIYNDSLAFRYYDNIMEVVIWASYNTFNLVIENKSSNSIKIMWNEASFVGTDGYTSQVMHSGIRYYDKEKLQTPTTIISGAKLSDCILPINHAEWDRYYEKWIVSPLYDHNERTSKGKTMKLMLPVLVKGVVNEYIFTFKVADEYMFPGVVKIGEDIPTIPYDIINESNTGWLI